MDSAYRCGSPVHRLVIPAQAPDACFQSRQPLLRRHADELSLAGGGFHQYGRVTGPL